MPICQNQIVQLTIIDRDAVKNGQDQEVSK